MTNLFGLICQIGQLSSIAYYALSFALVTKVVIVFIFLIVIRITVPRSKIEVLSKIGWLGNISIILAFGSLYIFLFLIA